MNDLPTVTVRHRIDAKGIACVVVEIAVEIRQSGMVLLVVDLSDSSQLTQADVTRLPRLLSPLPRTWGLKVMGFGNAATAATSRWGTITVGDVVDGVVDLGETLFNAAVITNERAAGSFLSPVLNNFLSSVAPETSRLFAVVVTDGKLNDVDPVRIPERMLMLGLAPEHGTTDQARWREIAPGATLIGRDTERDALGMVRAAAGCGFYGPCFLIVPKGSYRMRSTDDIAGGDTSPSNEKRQLWDFSLRGRLLLEFVGPEFPDHIIVEGADSLTVRLPVPKPSEADAAPIAPEICSMRGDAPDVHTLVLGAAESIALVRRAQELAESRSAWQKKDGMLAIAPPGSSLAGHLLDDTGRPRADGFLLIAETEIEESIDHDSGRLLLISLRRDSRLSFSSDAAASIPAPFSVGVSWSLHFDNRENRWMLSSANASPAPLSPSGSHTLKVDMRDSRGRSCHVFFSGPFRLP